MQFFGLFNTLIDLNSMNEWLEEQSEVYDPANLLSQIIGKIKQIQKASVGGKAQVAETGVREVDKLRPDWKVQPGHFDGAPYIFGPFSNWQPIRMQ